MLVNNNKCHPPHTSSVEYLPAEKDIGAECLEFPGKVPHSQSGYTGHEHLLAPENKNGSYSETAFM